jgi:hypothetical protein
VAICSLNPYYERMFLELELLLFLSSTMLTAELLYSVGSPHIATGIARRFLHLGDTAAITCVAANGIYSVAHCAYGNLLRLQGDPETQFGYSSSSHCLFRLLGYDDHWHTVIDGFHGGVHATVGDEHIRVLQNLQLRQVRTDNEVIRRLLTYRGGVNICSDREHHLPIAVGKGLKTGCIESGIGVEDGT